MHKRQQKTRKTIDFNYPHDSNTRSNPPPQYANQYTILTQTYINIYDI